MIFQATHERSYPNRRPGLVALADPARHWVLQDIQTTDLQRSAIIGHEYRASIDRPVKPLSVVRFKAVLHQRNTTILRQVHFGRCRKPVAGQAGSSANISSPPTPVIDHMKTVHSRRRMVRASLPDIRSRYGFIRSSWIALISLRACHPIWTARFRLWISRNYRMRSKDYCFKAVAAVAAVARLCLDCSQVLQVRFCDR